MSCREVGSDRLERSNQKWGRSGHCLVKEKQSLLSWREAIRIVREAVSVYVNEKHSLKSWRKAIRKIREAGIV